MKREIVCIVLISILAFYSTGILVSAQPSDNQSPEFPKVNIDVSPVLQSLGYNQFTSESIPEKLLVQIIRSYESDEGELGADGIYYKNITTNLKPDAKNLVGSDSVVQYSFETLIPDGSSDQILAATSSYESTDYLQEGKAALVFAVMDYEGEHMDLPQLWASYNKVTSTISTCNRYDYWNFKTDGDCTHYNVWAWITWACATYSSVDVTWLGHGTQVNGVSAYCPYDSWWEWWYPWFCGVIVENLFFPSDITTNGSYDYSPLRVGLGGFCYGGGLGTTFVNPGGSITHDRAFNGPEGISNTGYIYEFLNSLCTWWYPCHYNTWAASHMARVAAQHQIGGGTNRLFLLQSRRWNMVLAQNELSLFSLT